MELLVASSNEHKVVELGELFPGHRLLPAAAAGFAGFEVEEDGETYLANALKKAFTLHELSGKAVLADDSGLSVRALGGAPGIHSARYGSGDGKIKLDSRQRNALLLDAMKGIEDRKCAFVCCLVVVLSEHRFWAIQETCEGELLYSPRGEGGFGYDPIVYLPELGLSVAEIGMEVKNRLSHRGKAAARLLGILDRAGES